MASVQSPFITAPNEIRAAIRELVEGPGTIRAAVSFWGDGGSESVGLLRAAANRKKVKVLCNLESGATNPAEIQLLLKHGVRVRTDSRLHAKVWLGKHIVVTGSANLSANGLGLEGAELKGWREAIWRSTEVTAIAEATEWFESLWRGAREAEDAMKQAQVAWGTNRRRRGAAIAPGSSPSNLLDDLRDDPTRFADRNLYLVVCETPFSKEGKRVSEAYKSANGKGFDSYEDWDPP